MAQRGASMGVEPNGIEAVARVVEMVRWLGMAGDGDLRAAVDGEAREGGR